MIFHGSLANLSLFQIDLELYVHNSLFCYLESVSLDLMHICSHQLKSIPSRAADYTHTLTMNAAHHCNHALSVLLLLRLLERGPLGPSNS